MVWGGGTCCPLALDTGGVGSELSSDIESLELPGSVLVCLQGVPLGLGVLGQLVSFCIVKVTVASVCHSNWSTLAVSSSSGVWALSNSLSLLDSLLSDPLLSDSSFLSSPGMASLVSSASEVLGLWKCTFRLLRYFHWSLLISHLICFPWNWAVCSTKSKFSTLSRWWTRYQNFLGTSSVLSEVNRQIFPIPSHQMADCTKYAKMHLVSL